MRRAEVEKCVILVVQYTDSRIQDVSNFTLGICTPWLIIYKANKLALSMLPQTISTMRWESNCIRCLFDWASWRGGKATVLASCFWLHLPLLELVFMQFRVAHFLVALSMRITGYFESSAYREPDSVPYWMDGLGFPRACRAAPRYFWGQSQKENPRNSLYCPSCV